MWRFILVRDFYGYYCGFIDALDSVSDWFYEALRMAVLGLPIESCCCPDCTGGCG